MRKMRKIATPELPHGLSSEPFRHKKRFGQNFLVDRNILSEIVERAAVSNDVVLEVGAGEGVLTRELLSRGCAHVHAVELDFRLRSVLEKLQAEQPRLDVIWSDAMKVDYGALVPFPNKVVANIPYNITTPLIWKLLVYATLGLTYHLYMVQKEAADRLTAERDTKNRYPLGVTLEVMGKVTLVRNVPPSCFRPAPHVDSAVVEIELERRLDLMENSLWSDLLHACFRQRRKTLLNNLKGFGGLEDWRPVLSEADIDPKIRAEDLNGEEWLRLYSSIRLIDSSVNQLPINTIPQIIPSNVKTVDSRSL
jgi:16S rRNA (adenine1518-N6/adenine1519-N6)-dimethyltransferase